jgi:hypothetical protein
MATRLSNDYYTIAVEEVDYANMQKDLSTGVSMGDVVCEMHNDVMTADTKIKTMTLAPEIKEKIKTGSSATLTLKGNLCPEYEWLLAAYALCDSTPYSMTSPQPTGYSYSIYKYYPGTAAYYDVAVGCVMSDLKISGEANGILQFEATFRANYIYRAVHNDTGTDYPTILLSDVPAVAYGVPFLFGDVTVTLVTSVNYLLNFSLNLTKNFVDDRYAYMNYMTKLSERMTGYQGTWEYSVVYDDTIDPEQETLLGSNASLNTDTITFANADYTWAFVLNYRIDDFVLADADKSLFESKYTCSLVGDNSDAPLDIEITAL